MIKTKEDLKYYLKADAQALGIEKRGLMRKLVYPNLIWRFQIVLRKYEYYLNNRKASNFILLNWYRKRYYDLSYKLGFTIPPNVFGPGLCISHYGTIIVNGNTRIGAWCRIHACTNIGSSGGHSEAPVIGDNAYIGPGSLIFGDIKQGNDVTIAANATVNKSFEEDGLLLAGVPAKVVRQSQPNWLVLNRIKKI